MSKRWVVYMAGSGARSYDNVQIHTSGSIICQDYEEGYLETIALYGPGMWVRVEKVR